MSTILIVDDDFDIREALSDILVDEGFSVDTASDGLEALDYLRQNPRPAVILLDWMMPRCDGAQFRREQLAEPSLAAIPVVLLTADPRVEETSTARDVEAVLAKPVKLQRLLNVVRRLSGSPP